MSESTPSGAGSPTRLNVLMIAITLIAVAILCWTSGSCSVDAALDPPIPHLLTCAANHTHVVYR